MKKLKKQNLETNQNKSKIIQNIWNAEKAVLKWKFITRKSYLKKQEKTQINNLTLYLQQLEKEEETKHIVNRRKEIIKIRGEINEKVKRKQ